jgi:lambda family phage portal protein
MARQWFDTPLGQAKLAEIATETAAPRAADAPGRRIPNPYRGGSRAYAGGKPDRTRSFLSGVSDSSADAELAGHLRTMRSRSRELIRNASYARRARQVIVDNVVGTGIGLQARVNATRGNLKSATNEAIERGWDRWTRADFCHVGGSMHFHDMERAGIGQVMEAGEVLFRKHYQPFGASGIPFALELIEAERLADDFVSVAPRMPSSSVRMGVELDEYYRPVAYWLRTRHPGELRWIGDETDKLIRVPASEIIHLRLVNRWPQTRGEPWLATAINKLADMDGYSEAEVIAARGAANYLGVTESEDIVDPAAQANEAGDYEVEVRPGMNLRMRPGEKFNFIAPNRPNTALDPFLRYMVREVAAGVGISYESLSRDYSQSNYSSSRLALLDDRDAWRALQLWFIRNFRLPIHREFVRALALSRSAPGLSLDQYAADPEKFEAAHFKPRGWTWIDPAKEVSANVEAVKAGFTTVSQVIAENSGGRDHEDVMDERAAELEAQEAAGLVFETSPEFYTKANEPPAPAFGAAAPADPAADPAEDDDEADDEAGDDEGEPTAPARVLQLKKRF